MCESEARHHFAMGFIVAHIDVAIMKLRHAPTTSEATCMQCGHMSSRKANMQNLPSGSNMDSRNDHASKRP
jgi:hypothetical protein